MQKSTVMAGKNRSIFYLSKIEVGKVHDYKLFKNNFPPSLDWFSKLLVHIDLGYQGFESDYVAKTVLIPFKKNKGEKELSDLKKAYNRKLAQWRVGIEQAIGGMIGYRILAERIRPQRRIAQVNRSNQYDIGSMCWSREFTNQVKRNKFI
jgi:hypothetical protein